MRITLVAYREDAEDAEVGRGVARDVEVITDKEVGVPLVDALFN
jgi:hypothetical protein